MISATRISLLTVIFWTFLLTGLWIEITEPLKTISLMVISFYFGREIKSNQEELWRSKKDTSESNTNN